MLLSLPACYYDNEAELYGDNTCDTTGVRYSTDIVPLLQTQCYGCHDAGNYAVSGTQLDSYSQIKALAGNGKLISRTNDASNPMPPSQLMNECNRMLIQAWISAGAPNN